MYAIQKVAVDLFQQIIKFDKINSASRLFFIDIDWRKNTGLI